MRLNRVLTGVLGTAMLTAPLALSSPANAAASADVGTTLFGTVTTAFTSNADPVYGTSFRIVGQVFLVVGDTPAPLPDQTVTLQRRYAGSSTWQTTGTAQTKPVTMADGKQQILYTFTRTALRNASYRVRYDGMADSTAISGSRSDDGTRNPVTVRTHRRLPIRLLQPSPGHFRLAGRVTPEYAHKRVYVTRKTCKACAWKPFTSKLTGARGNFSVAISTPRSGSQYFAARATASTKFAATTSQLARIDAR